MMNPGMMHMGMPGMGMGGMGMMNPMMMGMGMMNHMMMHGMHGMGMMNPMMMGMGGMGMMNPMMMGMHHHRHHHHHHGVPHMNNKLMRRMFGGRRGGGLVGSYQSLGNRAGKINPMFNVNMGYMMGRAVKKCQPLKNGLEICAMYNPMTNQLNIDVKCKNCKKLKHKNKRLFPKQLSKMIRMLVKQRVFGSAGHDLLGGELERRFGQKVNLKPPKKKVEAKVKTKTKTQTKAKGKGKETAKEDKTAEKKTAEGGGAGDGVGNSMMQQMEGGQSYSAIAEWYGDDYAQYEYEYEDDDSDSDMYRRRLSEESEVYFGYDADDLVQFDTMDGNIGYSMWRAELMDWHNFVDYDTSMDRNDDFAEYGEYRNFGNFVHYFDSFEFDWSDQDSWDEMKSLRQVPMLQVGRKEISMEMGQKCGKKLPMTNFKLCSNVNDEDISVFFRKVPSEDEVSGAQAQYGNVYDGYENFREYNADTGDADAYEYDEYFDTLQMGTEFEANDMETLRSIIGYEFENIQLSFNNDEDWHEIITSYPGRHHGNDQRRQLLAEKGAIAGSRLGEHDHSESEISLFGRLYRLKGISKCGGKADSPRFCVGVHVGEPIKLPKTISLPMSKMCNFMYIAKVCLGFDPNAMSLKLSIQFQSIHKWKKIAKRILDVIKHLPHKMKRYMKWANTASISSARAMNGDMMQYDDAQYDYNEMYDDGYQFEEEEDLMALDQWYDADEGEQWVISAAQVDADNLYWDDADIWQRDQVGDEDEQQQGEMEEMSSAAVITTDKGRDVEKRCMHMMGGRLCLCQFLQWIDSPQYHCHPQGSFFDMMGPMAAAKATNLDIDDYLEVEEDGYDHDDDDDDEDERQEGAARMPVHYDGMSQYYDRMGPQWDTDPDEASNRKQFNAAEEDYSARYDYGYEDGNEYGDDYAVEAEEAEITDDFFYHKFNDIQSQLDAEWTAADFSNVDYHSAADEYDFAKSVDEGYETSMDEVYDYDDLLQNEEDGEMEEEFVHGFNHIDSRWVKHADDPDKLQEMQHPQQQKYSEHNLFIYNNYDDDITYSQKKYEHPQMEEEDAESADEWAIPVHWDGLNSYIEINSNMFWLLSLFAVFFGIMLCSLLFCYLKEREKFMREVSKQMGIPMMQKCGGEDYGKYVFNPINVALSQGERSSAISDSSDHDRSADELIG